MNKAKPNIAHILPGMYFGGVEVAILKSYRALSQEYNYEVFYVREEGTLEVGQTWVFPLVCRTLFTKKKPDLILTSLWWGHLVGILLSLTGRKWACFIHSPGHSSMIDFIITRLALILCPIHIFDSQTTKDKFSLYKNRKSFVIPYIFDDNNLGSKIKKKPDFTFSWIGRNSQEKRLDLLLKLMRSLNEECVDFTCCVCIAGDRDARIDRIASKSRGSIVVRYNVDPQDIKEIYLNSSMTVCLSDYEGFSVSTAEAAMSGNLICARRVGELSSYLCEESTIWLDNLSEESWSIFIKNIKNSIGNHEAMYKRRLASQTYTHKKLTGNFYVSSMMSCFQDLLRD